MSTQYYRQNPEMSAREIVEARIPNVLELTLDQIEHMDVNGRMIDWDMADLIAHASRVDALNRIQARQERRQKARQRLCRIIAGKYTRAMLEGDCDECDSLADDLVMATRGWCNGI